MSELGPYGHVRFELNGDPLFLPAKLAVSLALIFHELATNAAKYGALSNDDGHVTLRWVRDGDDLEMICRESGGPAVSPPTHSGFGSRVISDMVRAGLDGMVDVDFAPAGLRWHLRCPLQRLSRGSIHARR